MLYSEEREKIIIGNVILRGSMTSAEQKLSPTDFFFSNHALLWSVMLEIAAKGESQNPVEIHHRCKVENPATQLTIAEITQLSYGIPVNSTRPEDVEQLRKWATARRLQKTLAQFANQLETEDLVDVLNDLEVVAGTSRKELNITTGASKQLFEVMENEVFPRLDKFVSGETVKIGFGFSELDNTTNGGVGAGELVILGAKPKSGKSALTLQIASSQAMVGRPALIVSREMLNFENGFRFLAQNSRFSNNIFRPNLLSNVAEQLKETGRSHYALPLFFDDRSKTVSEIKREAKTLKETHELQSIFVDYAQLVRPEKNRNSRADDLEAIYYDLKELAQDLEVAVFLNAQFNRAGIKSDRPTMADFDGSSAAEKAGNLIILWNLEDEYSEMCKGKRGKLWIEAGRNVGTDEFDIVFHGAHSRFSFGDEGYLGI